MIQQKAKGLNSRSEVIPYLKDGFLPLSAWKKSGMSTIEEQKKYKEPTNLGTQDLSVPRLKPSEGSTKWVPVRWTLNQWLQGSDKQDEYPYLNGFVNSLKSAMSYTGSKTLNEFKS